MPSNTKKAETSQACGAKPAIPALVRLGQRKYELKASLGCTGKTQPTLFHKPRQIRQATG